MSAKCLHLSWLLGFCFVQLATPLTLRQLMSPAIMANLTGSKLTARDGFNKFGGCDKEYTREIQGDKRKGKDMVLEAIKDMLKMTQVVDPFLATLDSIDKERVYQAPGKMELRYFGSPFDDPDKESRKVVETVFQNSANWYPWWFFDWIWGRRIEVYCEVDQPNVKNYSCTQPRLGSIVGAYATSLNGVDKIVLCKSFFQQHTMTERKKQMDDTPRLQKNVWNYRSTAQLFFHEMTHLETIENKSPFIIHDRFQQPDTGGGTLVYGPRKAEKFAIQHPTFAPLNADNIALYAAVRWFQQFYGEPDPTLTDSSDPNGDTFCGGYSTDDSISKAGYNFEEIDWDEASAEEAIAFAAGEYTPKPGGWLRNRKLRILPLGDSITYGSFSSDSNGYRSMLYTILTNVSNSVEMVGSARSGSMSENSHEGHPGATIVEIASYKTAYASKPNVVLLHAGTNDMNNPTDPATAPQRLDALVGQLVAALPGATILVARIVPSTNSGTASRVSTFNNAIMPLLAARARAGQHVGVVDMPSGVSTSQLRDGIHPSDQGYQNMAIKWAIAITAVDALGWLKDAEASPSGGACDKDVWWIENGEIANGAGLGTHLWKTVTCGLNPIDGNSVCHCSKAEQGDIPVDNDRPTDRCETLALQAPLAKSVHFADLNGDGRAEYLWVDGNSAVTAYLNLGGQAGPEAAKVGWLPQGTIATGVGARRGDVHFADINGDGRAEYLWVHDDGSVDCWLNLGGPDNGPNAAKVGWLPQGKIATGVGKDGAGVRFADLNGDGRAEYLYVNDDGSVEAWLNLGGPDNGPNAAKVGWLPQGTIATGVGQQRENVVFADINGDKRADYIAMSRTDGSAKLWINLGGPDNGPNAAKVGWWEKGTIATGVGSTGKGVEFADLNGDGRAEYLDVKYDTSAVKAWLNGC